MVRELLFLILNYKISILYQVQPLHGATANDAPEFSELATQFDERLPPWPPAGYIYTHFFKSQIMFSQ